VSRGYVEGWSVFPVDGTRFNYSNWISLDAVRDVALQLSGAGFDKNVNAMSAFPATDDCSLDARN